MLSFRRISFDALITNKLFILGFLLLFPSYYCSSSTLSWPWPPLFFSSSHSYVLPLHKFFLLRIVMASFCTSSFHLFIGFPTGLLLPRLPSRIRFVILLSNIFGICPARFIILTYIYVTKSVSVHGMCSDLLYRSFQRPFSYTGPETLRSIFLSKEPYLWDIIGKRPLFTSK